MIIIIFTQKARWARGFHADTFCSIKLPCISALTFKFKCLFLSMNGMSCISFFWKRGLTVEFYIPCQVLHEYGNFYAHKKNQPIGSSVLGIFGVIHLWDKNMFQLWTFSCIMDIEDYFRWKFMLISDISRNWFFSKRYCLSLLSKTISVGWLWYQMYH